MRLAAMKGFVTDADTAKHVHRSIDCPSFAPASPSINQTSHQLCRGGVGFRAMRTLVAADSRIGVNGLAYHFDCCPSDRKRLDKKTFA